MAYIGTKPTIGNFQICDAISVVNGQAAYTMQVGSVNVIPQSANHMIVSLNSCIQKPNSSFTVSGSTITFSSNLVTGDVIDFIQILGDVLDLGVPSDATVTTAKLGSNAVTSAKMFSGFANGITEADQWRITSNFSGDASPLASNWERVDTDGFGQLGSGMTESSGVFTFPSTGIWLVIVQIEHEFANADSFTQFDLKTCTDGSTFGSASMASLGGRNDDHKSGFINHVLDVTNTSNVKCRLDLAGAHSSNVSLGDTNETNTGITFLKLGDT